MTLSVQKLPAVLIGLILAGIFTACGSVSYYPSEPENIVDLTHAFGSDTIYWPNNPPFQWEKQAWGTTEGGYWYASAKFSASEHGGTHLDAPIHFAEGRQTVDAIPLDRLLGPGVVVDVREACTSEADYHVHVSDLLAWEKEHGEIPEGAIVLIRTGWGEKWPQAHDYLGTQDLKDPSSLHFPGLSAGAAEFLATRRMVRGVGIDTASIDPGQSRNFLAHRILSQANVYALENVASLDRLPAQGFTVSVMPMKIRGGTGSPVRLIALLP